MIGVGTGAGALAAMRSGQIDGISNVEPIITMLEQKKEMKLVVSTRTAKETADLFGGAMPAATLYAYDDFLTKNPRTAQALANAIVRADRWLAKAGPSDVLKTVPESYQLGDKGLYLAAFAEPARRLVAGRADARVRAQDGRERARDVRFEDRSGEARPRGDVHERVRPARRREVPVTRR